MEITLNRAWFTQIASLLVQPKYKYAHRSAEIADYISAEMRAAMDARVVTIWFDDDASLHIADVLRTEIFERNVGTLYGPNIGHYLNLLVDLANNIDGQIADLLVYEEIKY